MPFVATLVRVKFYTLLIPVVINKVVQTFISLYLSLKEGIALTFDEVYLSSWHKFKSMFNSEGVENQFKL